jgi:hypothetical protein
MEEYNPLSGSQIGAIKRGIKLGRTLQKNHPEIAEMYASHSQSEILDILDIQTKYRVGHNVAKNGVRKAIVEHENGFKIKPYEGLISDKEERERIGRGHMVEAGFKLYKAGKGIHGRTAEQHSQDGRKGSRKGVIAR